MVLPLYLQKRVDAKNAVIAEKNVEDSKPVIEIPAKIKKVVNKKLDFEEIEENSDTEEIKPTKIFKNLSKYSIK